MFVMELIKCAGVVGVSVVAAVAVETMLMHRNG